MRDSLEKLNSRSMKDAGRDCGWDGDVIIIICEKEWQTGQVF